MSPAEVSLPQLPACHNCFVEDDIRSVSDVSTVIMSNLSPAARAARASQRTRKLQVSRFYDQGYKSLEEEAGDGGPEEDAESVYDDAIPVGMGYLTLEGALEWISNYKGA